MPFPERFDPEKETVKQYLLRINQYLPDGTLIFDERNPESVFRLMFFGIKRYPLVAIRLIKDFSSVMSAIESERNNT